MLRTFICLLFLWPSHLFATSPDWCSISPRAAWSTICSDTRLLQLAYEVENLTDVIGNRWDTTPAKLVAMNIRQDAFSQPRIDRCIAAFDPTDCMIRVMMENIWELRRDYSLTPEEAQIDTLDFGLECPSLGGFTSLTELATMPALIWLVSPIGSTLLDAGGGDDPQSFSGYGPLGSLELTKQTETTVTMSGLSDQPEICTLSQEPR